MSKKSKKHKHELPAPQEFAYRHGISVETARAILSSFDETVQENANEGRDQ
jgi:hypothetical protein